jgi:hypothetical protein
VTVPIDRAGDLRGLPAANEKIAIALIDPRPRSKREIACFRQLTGFWGADFGSWRSRRSIFPIDFTKDLSHTECPFADRCFRRIFQ